MLHRCVLRTALTLVLALLAAPTLGLLGGPVAAQATPLTAPAAPLETPSTAPATHPISGFFVTAASTDAANAATLEQVKQVGGDTVVTFGTTLRTASIDGADRIRTDGEINPAFAACRIGGKPCAATATAGREINRVFTFANRSHFSKGAVQCPQDRTFTSKGQRYTLLLIPATGGGCTASDGRYDLIAIHGGAAETADHTTSLLRAADQAGVQVYVGMPSAQKRTDVAWLPDLSYRHTLSAFTDRFLRYHKSVGETAALTGFYHHTEMPVAAGEVWQPVLDLYHLQNTWIAKRFPGKAALVSPYLDNRRSTNQGMDAQQLAAKTEAGARAIAGTAGDVPLAIAIQDGMGTGKGGSYLANDAEATVDGPAAALVGATTWASAYLMPVSDSFSAARKGLEGTGATLWSNVEGMTPEVGDSDCGTGQERGRTTKNRLDQQVQTVGRYTAKNISFMWDPFYTCQVGSTSLAGAMVRHGSAPLITNATLAPERDVLWLAGYNLAGSTATVKYVDRHGEVHQATSKISVHSADYGRRTGLDRRLESADYPVQFAAPQNGKIFIVWVTGQDGKPGSRSFSLVH